MGKQNQITFNSEDVVSLVTIEVNKIIKEECKKVVKEMKNDSNVPEKTGEYKRALSYFEDKAKNIFGIHEDKRKKKNQRGIIGHLLEKGTEDTISQPHWSKYEDKLFKRITNRIEKEL